MTSKPTQKYLAMRNSFCLQLSAALTGQMTDRTVVVPSATSASAAAGQPADRTHVDEKQTDAPRKNDARS
ncbi:hypothetical protein [Azospirillum sp. A23]|uniref:hypothetical protein n=1 Tax=Azospirillum sp. A23 TaxID=3160608 RepID=UPI0036F43867